MVIRLVQMRIKPDRIAEFQRLYEEVMLPVLERMDGCRYAALIQNILRAGEGSSLTLWDSAEHADAYERSGAFDRLLAQSKPFFAEGDEWKLQLTDDAQLQFTPVVQEPVVKSYSNPTPPEKHPPPGHQSSFMFLRMVKMIVRPGMDDEFKRVYEESVQPELLQLPGCRSAYVVHDLETENEWISLTIWDRKEDADRHEEGGSSARLRARLAPMLSGLYQWKLGMEKDLGKQAITSEDVAVSGYRVLIGKRFGN